MMSAARNGSVNAVDTYMELRKTFPATLNAEVDKLVNDHFAARDEQRSKIGSKSKPSGSQEQENKSASTQRQAGKKVQTANNIQLPGSPKILWSQILQGGLTPTNAPKLRTKTLQIKYDRKQSTEAEGKEMEIGKGTKEERTVLSWADEVNDAE